MSHRLVIATRESPLALVQAEWVKTHLQRFYPDLKVELLGITTQADKMLNVTLDKIGGKGLFVKELEEALLTNKADIAVHSMKDVPMQLPEGLCLSVICEREDPRDAFVSNTYSSLEQLPPDARVGSSSLRRKAQLLEKRRDLSLNNLRGNIGTRLNKLDAGEFDAIVLAVAGLKRLALTNRITDYFSATDCLPAAGQGALGIECRSDDQQTLDLIRPLNHFASFLCVSAERIICRRLNAGCMVPVAAFAELQNDSMSLTGLVANEDGSIILRSMHKGHRDTYEQLGERVADHLLEQGAEAILQSFYAK